MADLAVSAAGGGGRAGAVREPAGRAAAGDAARGPAAKGGRRAGAFRQIPGTPAADLDVPGRPYPSTTRQAARAGGDRRAPAGRGRPPLHLHLTDRAAGLGQLLEAVP